MGILERIQHGWNAFVNNRDPTYFREDLGPSYATRPDRTRFSYGNERTIVTAIFNRIALDVAATSIRHVQLDKEDRFQDYIKSSLDYCLSTEANIDQTSRAFIQDVVISMLDEGCVAIVPVDTDMDVNESAGFKILTMRTGRITQWYPEHVKVNLYNPKTGRRQDIIMKKTRVAIIENPFYSVINERNSITQRLIRKLSLLDAIDEQSGSGKLDLIVQLPYSVKSQMQQQRAEERRKSIEDQLTGSKYGIAYIDATEHVTQLNRSLENNLMKQIEYLTTMLYGQLSITQGIMDGTADESTMLNYTNRTVEPFVAAIVDGMKRVFLTKTARTQGQSIMYFRDPFKFITMEKAAEIGDKFTRNEILSSNEIRQGIGFRPSKDPQADELRNSNLNHPDEKIAAVKPEVTEKSKEGEENQNG